VLRSLQVRCAATIPQQWAPAGASLFRALAVVIGSGLTPAARFTPEKPAEYGLA